MGRSIKSDKGTDPRYRHTWTKDTYTFKDLYKEILIGSPAKVGSLGSR